MSMSTQPSLPTIVNSHGFVTFVQSTAVGLDGRLIFAAATVPNIAGDIANITSA